MADRYWVGGTGTWDSTNTANWSTSSGGAGGASVPTASDNVFFDAGSDSGGIFTVTMANTPRLCNDFTASGLDFTMTLAGTAIGLTVSGSLSFPATNFTRTYTGTTTFDATTTGKTITTNGVAFGAAVTLDGVGGAWTLGSAFSCGTSTLTLTNGTFNTSVSNYAVTAGNFSSSNSNTRTINLNASTITLSGSWFLATSTNATLNAGTSTINLSGTSVIIDGGNLTYYNVSFTSTAATTSSKTITGTNTLNNLTFSTIGAAGRNDISINANQTINGTFTVNGANGSQRQFIRSSNVGLARTLTCAAIASTTDVDFRDITIAGAHGTLSGTRLGDCGGNSNITFVAGASKYWNLAAGGNWSATAWALSSGGSVAAANFPLAQDTVIIENTGLNTSATVTINASYNIGSLDTSTRTNAMTLASGSTSPIFYGNFTYGSGVTPTGTGTYIFSNRATKTLNSGGKTFTQFVTIDAPGGGIQLLTNNLTLGSTLTTTFGQGTLDLNNQTLTTGRFSSSNFNTRTIAFGTGNITCTGTGTAWTTSAPTGLTVTGTPVVNITSTGSIAITVTPGVLSEANSISFNFTGGTYALTFLGGASQTARNVNFTGYAGTWLLTGSNVAIYGNLTLSTGMSLTATTNTFIFAATSGTKTITSNGKTMDFPVTFNGAGGTWQLQDAMTLGSSRLVTFTNGTVDLNGFTLTSGTGATATGTKNITFNGGTLLLSGGGATAWNNAVQVGFTTTAGTGTGAISMTAATAKTFVSGDSSLVIPVYNCALNQGGAGTLTINNGSVTFNDITNTNATASQITFSAGFGVVTTVNNFTLSGSSGNLVSLRSSTPATQFTLSKSSGTVSVSYLDIQDSNATGGAVWSAPTSNGNVDSGNNAGWIFTGGLIYSVNINETATGADTIQNTMVMSRNINETAAGVDTIATKLTRVGAVSETATGVDTTASQLTALGAVSETATGADTEAATLTQVGAVDEAATGADELTNTASLQLFVAETATGADTIASQLDAVGTISETATGADELTNTASLQLFIAETATGADELTNIASLQLFIAETATGVDTITSQLDAVAFIDESSSPGSIVQNTSALPTGTSFTGSTIFDNTSAGGGLAVVANGTGIGSNGGFNAGGNYILFSGVNTRSVKTIALDLTTCSTFSFSIIRGNNLNGGETPDTNENIVVEYSTNGGGSYTTIDTILNTAAITTFTTLSYSMPVGAKTSATIIRWRQAASSQSTFDNYGIQTFTFDVLLPGGASAADTTASQLTVLGAVLETTTGADTTVSQLDAVGAVSETATGADTTAGQLDAVGAVSETATGADAPQGNIETTSAVSETATGADTTATALTRVGAVDEAATGADTTATQLDAFGGISETATGADTTASQLNTSGAVSETATGADELTNTASLQLFIAETATGADALTTQLDGVAVIDEAAIAEALAVGNIITTLQINEGATILDESLARLLWELINDNQLPGWQVIQNAQGTGWTVINTNTGTSWNDIDTV